MREFTIDQYDDDLHDVLDKLDRLSANHAKIGKMQKKVIGKRESTDTRSCGKWKNRLGRSID